MNFGFRLKMLRLDKNLSQAQLAQAIGLSTNTISQYETGKRFPNQNGIVIICRYFNISSDYLLGLTNQKYAHKDFQGNSKLNEKQKNAINDLITAFINNEE